MFHYKSIGKIEDKSKSRGTKTGENKDQCASHGHITCSKVLHAYAAYACGVSMLHQYATQACCTCMLRKHVTRVCCANMLHAHTAQT